MMYWRYQVMKHTEEDGEVWYGIHEWYDSEELDQGMHTTNPVTPTGATVEELQKALYMMLADLREYPVKNYK